MRVAVCSRRLTTSRANPGRVLKQWHRLIRPYSDRISPDQGCLEIAVMLQESPRFRRTAAAARRDAPVIVFFDRCAALIRVFAIGAYKPV
jgi:hypothetical protein